MFHTGIAEVYVFGNVSYSVPVDDSSGGGFCFEKLVLTLFLFIACVLAVNIWEGFPDAIVDTVGQRNPF